MGNSSYFRFDDDDDGDDDDDDDDDDETKHIYSLNHHKRKG